MFKNETATHRPVPCDSASVTCDEDLCYYQFLGNISQNISRKSFLVFPELCIGEMPELFLHSGSWA